MPQLKTPWKFIRGEQNFNIWVNLIGQKISLTCGMFRRYNSTVTYLDVNIPIISEDEFVESFVRKLDEDPEINFTVIDHITSASALLLPVDRLIKECKKRNIMVCIDGAHAPGQVELNLEKLRPDFYVGNLHKWCYAVRGTV